MKELIIDLKDYEEGGSVFKRTAVRGIITREKGDGTFEILMISGKYGDYKFPGGGMEDGEALLDTLAREVREETGFKMKEGSAREFCLVHEKRAGELGDCLSMENYYFFCEVEGEQGEQDLDEYEKEYEYRGLWILPDEAIAKNEEVLGKDNIPWVQREATVLREIIKDSLPVLETERLFLRALDMEDKKAVFQWAGDDRVTKFILYSTYKSEEEIIHYVPNLYKVQRNLSYGIVLKESGELVGAVDLIWKEDLTWTIGYNLRYDQWNKGIVTEAMRAVIEYGKKRFGVKTVEGTFAVDNVGSRRVMEKLGMTFKENTEYTKWDGSATFQAEVYSVVL